MSSRSKKCKISSGSALLESIIGIALMTGLVLGALEMIEKSNKLLCSESEARGEESKATHVQENFIRGVNDENSNFKVSSNSISQKDKGRLGCGVVTVFSDYSGQRRRKAAAYSVSPKGIDLERQRIQLQAPVSNTPAKISPDLFPILRPFKFLENPYGTFYRYTVDGSMPNEQSMVWDHPTITLKNIPEVLSIRAFNKSHIPSETTRIEFDVQLHVEFKREGGSANRAFRYSDIQQGKNRIILHVAPSLEEVDLLYGFAKETCSIQYDGPFHVSVEYWSSSGCKLYVRVKPKSPDYKKVIAQEIDLTIQKEKLSRPKIVSRSGLLVRPESRVEILYENSAAETRTSINAPLTDNSSRDRSFSL